MEHRYLGATGLKVSELCLGAMMFGSRTDEQASVEILNKFTDAGGSFIDTADIYGPRCAPDGCRAPTGVA